MRALLRSANGLVDVESLALPVGLVSRVADRSIRHHYRLTQRRFPNVSTRWPTPVVPGAKPAPRQALDAGIDAAATDPRAQGEIPQLRGVTIAPMSGAPPVLSPFGADLSTEQRRRRDIAERVARRLPTDGLVRTAAWAAREVGADSPDELASVGIPVDLLACFDAAGEFRFTPTIPGFRAQRDDSGDPELIRWQVQREDVARHGTPGGAVDVLVQCVRRTPRARHLVATPADCGESLAAALGAVLGDEASRTLIVDVPHAISPWARDNAILGDGATLLPRYASRNEHNTRLMLGDSLIWRRCAAHLRPIAHSPLLFQGGDVVVFQRPASGVRVALVGEAEISRNAALGLTPAQAESALRVELGVDELHVLPAISLHIDLEMTLRSAEDRVIAFVADDAAAAAVVVRAGVEALAGARFLAERQRATLLRDLDEGRTGAVARTLHMLTAPLFHEDARGVERLSAAFDARSSELGAGQAGRFLVAIDHLLAASYTLPQLRAAELAPEMKRYLAAFKRRSADREALWSRLRSLGLAVHAVPTLSDEELAANPLNGVHTRDSYLMPAIGGALEPLDRAAAAALAAALPADVQVIPIVSERLQAGYGGIRCATSVYCGG